MKHLAFGCLPLAVGRSRARSKHHCPSAKSQEPIANSDPLLRAMKDEIKRVSALVRLVSRSALLHGVPRRRHGQPYNYSRLGALVDESDSAFRVPSVRNARRKRQLR